MLLFLLLYMFLLELLLSLIVLVIVMIFLEVIVIVAILVSVIIFIIKISSVYVGIFRVYNMRVILTLWLSLGYNHLLLRYLLNLLD